MFRRLNQTATFTGFIFLWFMLAATAQETPISIEYSESITGEITHETPQVRYMFNGSKDEVIVIEMISVDRNMENTLSEPVLKLLDPTLQVIADTTLTYAVDDTILVAELPEDGRYIIIATHDPDVPRLSTGGFTLELTQISELTFGNPIEDQTTSSEFGRYYFVRSENMFNITYERLSGEYAPEVSVNRILAERGSLQAVARTSGIEMREARLGQFQPGVTYIIQLKQDIFDFQFDSLNTLYRLSMTL